MERYRFLYVEDNPTEFEMVKALLEDAGILESIKLVENKKDFLKELNSKTYHLILTDYDLPLIHGLEVLQIATSEDASVPVIFITETFDDDTVTEVLRKGAYDYVLLQNIYRLPAAIRNTMAKKRMEDDRDATLIRLKESEENYRILAESSPYGIIVHNAGKLIYYNRQAIKIFRADQNTDYTGRNILDFLHPEYYEVVKERTRNLYKGISYPDFFQEIFVNPDGELIQVEVASTAIVYNGEPSAQVIFTDISERKKMEQELIMAKEKAEETDKLKTSFLENMSHEIRTPLNGIIGFSTLLKYKTLDEKDRIKYLDVIEQSGKHLLNIINDLIEISRIESGHIDIRKEIFNLNTLLDDLFVFFSKSAQMRISPVLVSLQKDAPDDFSCVITDPSRLKQILINLLNNALKFTSKGSIDFGYEKKDEKIIQFFVKDSGIGIPDNAKEYIFERFRQADDTKTREFGGAGLGLTISKGLVDILGGNIWFESEYEQGTSFYFTLPLSFKSCEVSKSDSDGDVIKDIDWTGNSILIAEDEQSNFILLKHILKPTGISVTRAENGLEVMHLLDKDERAFDVILMDIKMPEMDGLETIKRIRKKKYNIRAIAQTAYAMTDDRQKCINAGFDEYITKPLKTEELLKLLSKFIK